jgi:hypothetical protein
LPELLHPSLSEHKVHFSLLQVLEGKSASQPRETEMNKKIDYFTFEPIDKNCRNYNRLSKLKALLWLKASRFAQLKLKCI